VNFCVPKKLDCSKRTSKRYSGRLENDDNLLNLSDSSSEVVRGALTGFIKID